MALPRSLLIANRGEIAIRVARTARRLGIRTVAIHPDDDRTSLHTRVADHAVMLSGRGAAAYLDIDAVVAAAVAEGCDAVHPGYGFLSESAAFATACSAAGLTFVGPTPEQLSLLGDKARARKAAVAAGLSVLRGTEGPVDADGAVAFHRSLVADGSDGAIMLKAVAGGGGRGMRVVRAEADIADAFSRCSSEALAAFGDGRIYVEELLPIARHIEVQIVGDGASVMHLGERDCSVQRRHQKLIEIAPAPNLSDERRERLHDDAVRLAQSVGFKNIGTIEFLLDPSPGSNRHAFIEANPRIQVEHTVTEQVTGIDVVEVQLRLAGGASLDEVLTHWDGRVRGWAIQARVNMEAVAANGDVTPAVGDLTAYDIASGPGIRVDGYGYTGYPTSASYDSLLAKVIAQSSDGDFGDAARRLDAALAECRITGVETNIALLRDIVTSPAFLSGDLTTGLFDQLAAQGGIGMNRHVERYAMNAPVTTAKTSTNSSEDLAVGDVAINAPMTGTVVAFTVDTGAIVTAGQLVAVIEAMKMEHEVRATSPAIVRRFCVRVGDTVRIDTTLVIVEPTDSHDDATPQAEDVDLDSVRADLAHIIDRHRRAHDEARPDAVAKRHRLGLRTARENVDDLVDAGTFVEYGPLAIAAQRRRRSVEELIDKSPADGMVTGVGSVNGALFDDPAFEMRRAGL